MMTGITRARLEAAQAQQEQEVRDARSRAEANDLSRILEQPRFSKEERSIMLQTCCGGASEKEAEQLIAIAEARGLNPIKGECYFVKRWDSARSVNVWAVQAGIDSLRIKADETGLYDGQDEPEYEHNKEGEVTLSRVRVWRKGISRAFVGVARWSEYVQYAKDGKTPTRFWERMPYNQLAKCAEALALRKAFPKQLSKVYVAEEMAQADNPVFNPTTIAHDAETGKVVDPRTGPGIGQSVTVTYDKSWQPTGEPDDMGQLRDREPTVPRTPEVREKSQFLQWERREAQIANCRDRAALDEVTKEIAKDTKVGLLTIEQSGKLRDFLKKRRAELANTPAAKAADVVNEGSEFDVGDADPAGLA